MSTAEILQAIQVLTQLRSSLTSIATTKATQKMIDAVDMKIDGLMGMLAD